MKHVHCLSFVRNISLFAAGILFAGSAVAVAQQNVAHPGAAVATPARSWKFEVVSIRPDKERGKQEFGSTANGYRLRHLFMVMPILTAYVPLTGGAALYTDNQMTGFPDWVLNDGYDIDAKVAGADLADWQNPALQPEMLRSMLQAMLTDRLKLVVHRGTQERSAYDLALGGKGLKFKETKPGEPHPGGITIPGGTVVVPEMQNGQFMTHYYGISMATLASLLSGMTGRPVEDKTGLTDKYDVTLPKVAPLDGKQEAGSASDPGPSVFSVVEELGLKLKSSKAQVETLVIDHVERPSEN